MSAFVVSDHHINRLLQSMLGEEFERRFRLKDGSLLVLGRNEPLNNFQQAAEILKAENVRSVQARYPDTVQHPENMPGVTDEVCMPITFKFAPCPLSPVEVIKGCDCLSYQSCETDDWEETDAFQIVQGIRGAATYRLSGYDGADWEIKK